MPKFPANISRISNHSHRKSSSINGVNYNDILFKQLFKQSLRTSSNFNTDRELIDKLFIFNERNLQASYSNQKLLDLIRSYSLLKISSSGVILNNYDKLLTLSKKILGDKLFHFLVRNTVYSQFIAGEDEKSVNQQLKKLSSKNIGGIIDYAIESDLPQTDSKIGAQPHQGSDLSISTSAGIKNFDLNDFLNSQKKLGFTENFDITSDPQMEMINRFIKSIEISSSIDSNPGFVALKITSMCDTVALKKINQYFNLIEKLFDENKSVEKDYIEEDKFYKTLEFLTKGKISRNDSDKIYRINCSNNKNKKLHFYDFAQILFPVSKNNLVGLIINQGKNENAINQISHCIDEFEALYNRLDYICSKADGNGVRLMIDAEQSYFQNSIHIMTLLLQKKYNRTSGLLYNTYQSYLKKTFQLVNKDINYRNNCVEEFILGVKLVRGAYDVRERQLADELNLPSPVCDSYQDTNISFNNCADLLVENVSKNRASLNVASHNSDSIAMIVNRMKHFNIKTDDKDISFAQLLGMSDYITFILAKNEYNVYKYMPYGPVNEVLPYLARRISENRSVFNRVKVETDMIFSEICKKLGLPSNIQRHDYRNNRNINSE